MKRRLLLTGTFTAMMLGGSLTGCSSGHGPSSAASKSVSTRAAKAAAKDAEDARKALADRKMDRAVERAERAVARDAQNAAYRTVLGQAYLLSGRFVSAEQALNDALSLDPASGEAALNLALAQVGLGKWDRARTTLGDHAQGIPASDRGLALALAGDPNGAVALLSDAVRDPAATAKTRQNFALALALSGRWMEAKAVAQVDMSPADVDQRLQQWAQFARPANAYDQVASLLGVTPVEDGGQPAALALANVSTQLAAASPVVDSLDAYMPGPVAAPSYSPVIAQDSALAGAMGDSGGADASESASTEAGPDIRFAAAREIAQPVPARSARTTPSAVAMTGYKAGDWYVQLGAYGNRDSVKIAWQRVTGRVSALSTQRPHSTSIKAKGSTFYRLSVGGFSRGDAVALCGKVRASGGKCFVRAEAGDKLASWAKGLQVASR